MSVPNDFPVVQQVFDTAPYDLKTHDGQAAFVDAVVWALHLKDPRWGHLKKKPGQSAIHGHAEDAALYLSDTPGLSQAVDFIGGAGTDSARIQWLVDLPRYSFPDWLAPKDHDLAPVPPAPPPAPAFPYPDENTTVKAFQVRVKDTYKEAKRAFPDPNDPDAFRHFTRYGFSCHEMPEPKAADKHIAELRADLGLP
jgi:hypothetical protein